MLETLLNDLLAADHTFQWPFFLSAFVIAFFVKVVTTPGIPSVRRILADLFNPKVWFHRSARLDYSLIVLNALIAVALIPPSLYMAPKIADQIKTLLTALLGPQAPVWDVLFGTAYLPNRKERIAYGLADSREDHHTLKAAYWTPLRDIWHSFHARSMSRD